MKTAYLDCFSGISGDMTLGALIHGGLEIESLVAELGKLDLSGYRIEAVPATRGSLAGIRVQVIIEKEQPSRNLDEILSLIDRSLLSTEVKEKSKKIFHRLGAAEAEVHGTDLDSIHFHEVGAVDAIVDIVGSVIGMEMLGIRRVMASSVNVGQGIVETEHGVLPVPAPATAMLLRGRPTYTRGPSMELTTPTGAAILAGLASEFGSQPLMKIESIGYGLGNADPLGWPNCLRLLIGEEDLEQQDQCWIIESNIDDMNPEFYGFVMERLFDAGALDVFFTPIVMKKTRPATRVSVLSPMGKEDELASVLFRETTAIGVRRYQVERQKLMRKTIQVQTPYGDVDVKLGLLEDEVVNFSPEFESCRKRALEKKVPLKWVYNAALSAAREKDA